MIGWLYRLLVGSFSRCEHKWKTLDYAEITSDGVRVGRKYYLECTKCGEVKQKRLTL